MRNREPNAQFGLGLWESSPTRRGDRNQGRHEFRAGTVRSNYLATEDHTARPFHAGMRNYDQKSS